jgi:hypothetical protein
MKKKKPATKPPRTNSVYVASWVTPQIEDELKRTCIEQRRPLAFIIREAIQYYLATQTTGRVQ